MRRTACESGPASYACCSHGITCERCRSAARLVQTHTRDRLIYRAIAVGVLIPIVYYGLQLIAIPFAKNYNWIKQVASELGMTGISKVPAIFNLGKIFGTIPTWIAAFGFLFGLKQMGANRIAIWLTFLAMIAIALGDIQAGLFPLPDPRHEGIFLIGYPLWAFSFLAIVSSRPKSRGFKTYLIVNIVLTVLMITARIVLGESSLSQIQGLFQRIFAFFTIVPFGVAAWFLAQRFKEATMQSTSLLASANHND
ncbi:MAG: hypothetical protein C5B54_03645 [Acidobacteria bacterium]|nr:MAG: hypothetical protein C5B54_03645 [Acidobacteriota bacterium]